MVDGAVALQAEVLEGLPQHDLDTDLRKGYAGGLGDERYGSGGTGVGLDHEDLSVLHGELQVHQTLDLEGERDLLRDGDDLVDGLLLQGERRKDHRGVSGVASCVLHVLHDPADVDVGAVADAVHVDLDRLGEVLVDEDRVVAGNLDGGLDIRLQFIGGVDDLHRPSSEDVGRPDENRVSDALGDLLGLLEGVSGSGRGLLDLQLVHQLGEPPPVLGHIHLVGACSEYPGLGSRKGPLQVHGEVDGSLSAVLDDDAVGVLGLDDVENVPQGQGLEVKTVRDVVVGGDGLGVVVDDDGIHALLLQRHDSMDAAVVELDTLADPDGSGSDEDNLLVVVLGGDLRGPSVGAVEVRGLGGELRGAGVDHLVDGPGALGGAELPDLQGVGSADLGDGLVGESHVLGLAEGLRVDGSLEPLLHLDHVADLLHVEDVPFGEVGDLLHVPSLHEGLGDGEDASVGGVDQLLLQLLVGELEPVQSLDSDLQGAEAFQQGLLEGPSDGHDLPGALHLGSEVAVHGAELVEGPAWDLDDHVVDGRLEGGIGGAGDLVGDLVEGVSDGDLGGDPGDGVSGRLGCEGGGPGHTGVDLDQAVVPVGGVECELDVAASLDPEGADDLQRGGSEALVVVIREREAGGDDYALPCVDTHGVEVLHVADDDAVVRGIPHDLVLVLLPSEDALLDEDLVDPGVGESAGADVLQLLLVVGDASAGSSEGVCGSDEDGVASDDPDSLLGLLDGVDAPGDGDGLSDALHGLLEQLPVLGHGDGIRLRSHELGPEPLQLSGVGEL